VTRSELISALNAKQPHLSAKDVELAVKSLLDRMVDSFVRGERVEIRGFGAFSVKPHPKREGRNPMTGETVIINARRVINFKSGLAMRKRIDQSRLHCKILKVD
jgi:integration host factor subunit beta